MGTFSMPSLGADMEAGTLVEWLKHPGDRVERGDIVAVVETQKGAIEVEVFEAGVIERLLVEPGTTVPVGTPLALVRGPGEERDEAPVPELVSAEAACRRTGPPCPGAALPRLWRRQDDPAPPRRPAGSPASAASISPDLPVPGRVARVVSADIDRLAATPTPAPIPFPPARLDLAEMRRAIAAAMARSKREIPHYYLSTTIDLTRAQAYLEGINAERPPADRLLLSVLLLKAVALALRRMPEFNGFYTADGFQPGTGIHIGTAIAIRGGGLATPAIHDTDRLSLDALMAHLRDLVARTRVGRVAQLRAVGCHDHGDQPGRPRRRVRLRRHLPASGRDRRLRHAGRAPLGRRTVRSPSARLITTTLAADHRVSDGHKAACSSPRSTAFCRSPKSYEAR